MKNEAETCTIFKNSLIAAGYKGYKIPDPSGDYGKTIKRPFDIMGSWANNLLLVEAKFESSLKSFDLQRIEDHQIEELLDWQKKIPGTQSWIVLGVKAARADNRIYIFKDMKEIERRRNTKENYLKKELEKLPYYEVHKDLIDLTK